MPENTLTGKNFIGSKRSSEGRDRFNAFDPAAQRSLEPSFAVATREEIREMCQLAAGFEGMQGYAPPAKRAELLEAVAVNIEALGDALIDRASAETGLPPARLVGERGRTCGQLRMFANLLQGNAWQGIRIDKAEPERTPVPKPEIRRILLPIGPVAVYGASNFPLAFSVAGGDTASALAAGCSVVVKAHESHPGTSELVAGAINRATAAVGVSADVFSMLFGGAEQGKWLAEDPNIKAVAFTGSHRAGRALFELAARRSRPIPVFAEMGSVNPVFVLPSALEGEQQSLATGYATSLTVGGGQFCTNPGVLVGLDGPKFDQFVELVSSTLQTIPPQTMLNPQIYDSYSAGVRTLSAMLGVELLLDISEAISGQAAPALFRVTAEDFLSKPELRQEVFGPAAIVVRCASFAEMVQVAVALEGQLTASLLVADARLDDAAQLIPTLAKIAGRVIVNGFPTGVEVCPSMQHGGPYPATTDSRFTSVGTAAIERFLRPIAFQNVPTELLPEALR